MASFCSLVRGRVARPRASRELARIPALPTSRSAERRGRCRGAPGAPFPRSGRGVAIDEVAWLVRPRLPVPRPGGPLRRPPRARGAFLEAADLPVGRDASASRSTRSRGSYDLVCSCRFRPSRSSAASKTSRSQSARGLQRDPSSKRPTSRSAGTRARRDRRGRVARTTSSARAVSGRAGARPLRRRAGPRARGGFSETPPRSGRPPGRPGRERVAIDEVAWLVRPRLPVPFPAEQELGRFEDEQVPERAGASARPSSKRPTSRSAGTRARRDRRGRVARTTSSARAVSGRAGARPLRRRAGPRARGGFSETPPRSGRPPGRPGRERVAIDEVAWLVRPRLLVPFPAEQELGRFEDEQVPERGGGFSETPPRSGRPPGRPGRERVAIDEVAWLVRPRLLVPFPAEQELGRFEDEQVPERGGASARPSSKRPTSRSAGTRARRDRRGRVARTTSSARAVSGRAGARPLRRRAGPRAHGGFSETPPRSGRPPGRPEPENRRRCEREGLAADAVAPGTEPSLARRSPVATGARRNKGAASGFLRMSSRDLPLGRPASSIRQLPSMRSGASAERVAAGFSGPARPAGAPFGSLSRKGRNP
jgi:hypothetical protein